MKKIINIITIIMILSAMFIFAPNTYVKAENETYTMKLKEINNKDIELYVLLPKEYVEFAIEKDGLNIKYQGVNTLVNNNIPSIKVESGKIYNEVYKDGEVEYLQILLNKNEEGYYNFDVLSEYKKMNIKYRAIVPNGDFIVHIDNFKIEDNLCAMEYDSESNTIKQPDKDVISVNSTAIIAVAIVLVLVIWGSKGGK